MDVRTWLSKDTRASVDCESRRPTTTRRTSKATAKQHQHPKETTPPRRVPYPRPFRVPTIRSFYQLQHWISTSRDYGRSLSTSVLYQPRPPPTSLTLSLTHTHWVCQLLYQNHPALPSPSYSLPPPRLELPLPLTPSSHSGVPFGVFLYRLPPHKSPVLDLFSNLLSPLLPIGSRTATSTTDAVRPPPRMKPRVAATLWEDEGSLCFQVEARGVCVARREGKQPRPPFWRFMP